MSDQEREKLLVVIEELGRRYPNWRMGQLIANIAGWADQEIWDIEDEQLLAAAQSHLEQAAADDKVRAERESPSEVTPPPKSTSTFPFLPCCRSRAAFADGPFRAQCPALAPAVGGDAAGLLGEEGDGIGFVEKPELSLGMRRGWGIEEDATFEERAVKIGHQRADVARGIRAARAAAAKVGKYRLYGSGKPRGWLRCTSSTCRWRAS